MRKSSAKSPRTRVDMDAATLKKRFGLIDALRGFWLLNMIAYHLCFDIFHIYGLNSNWMFTPGAVIWERCICISFILISGISLNFSRHAYRRGLIVSACGALMTAVTLTVIPSFVIWFGVLTLIGAAILLTQALRRLFEKLPPAAGLLTSLAMFLLFYNVQNGWLGFFGYKLIVLPRWLYQNLLTAFFGFPGGGFISSDYFPLLPWIFLFWCGFFLWRLLQNIGADRFFKPNVPVLSFIGRYTLWIYLAHQPLLMGICFLIFGHF